MTVTLKVTVTLRAGNVDNSGIWRETEQAMGLEELLLVAADGRTRALLLAELQEAGYNVVALPSLEVALVALATGRVDPALVVLDSQGDPRADRRGIGQLLNLLEEDVPLVLVVGAYDARTLAPLRPRVAVWLSRPLRVGDIVAAIRRILGDPKRRG